MVSEGCSAEWQFVGEAPVKNMQPDASTLVAEPPPPKPTSPLAVAIPSPQPAPAVPASVPPSPPVSSQRDEAHGHGGRGGSSEKSCAITQVVARRAYNSGVPVWAFAILVALVAALAYAVRWQHLVLGEALAEIADLRGDVDHFARLYADAVSPGMTELRADLDSKPDRAEVPRILVAKVQADIEDGMESASAAAKVVLARALSWAQWAHVQIAAD